MRRLLKTQLLIDYCRRYGKLVELLERVKETNEYQYEKFVATLHTTSNQFQKQESSIIKETYGVLEITIAGNFSNLSSKQLEAVVGAFSGVLADILSVPQHEIHILDVAAGSLVLRLQMPSKTVTQLETMYKENKMLVKELGIQRIKPTIDMGSSTARFLEGIKKGNPNLSDEAMVKLGNIILEELGRQLGEGSMIAFIKPGSDKSSELTIFSIENTEYG